MADNDLQLCRTQCIDFLNEFVYKCCHSSWCKERMQPTRVHLFYVKGKGKKIGEKEPEIDQVRKRKAPVILSSPHEKSK